MYGSLPSLLSTVPPVPYNPSNLQRHQLIYDELVKHGRPEDYHNIMRHLSPPHDITTYAAPGTFRDLKVAVVGGGLAGMSAAFELRKLGFDITIFEPRTDRIGGRVYTHYFDKDKRLYGELGAARFPVSHEITWHYVNLFKLNTESYIETAVNTFIYVRDTRVRNDPSGGNIQYRIYPQFALTIKEKNTPWPKIYTQVLDYYLSTLPSEVREQLLMILKEYDARLRALMRISLEQAMQKYGLSEGAADLITSVISLLESLTYNSFEVPLLEYYTMNYSNLYKISGGTVNLPLSFYKSLTNPYPVEYGDIPKDTLGKVHWRGGQLVTGVYKSDENGKVTLSYQILPDTGYLFENFDYVLFAIPMTGLRVLEKNPLFSLKKMQAIRDIFYQDAQKTLFLCNERFWERQEIFAGTSYTDRIIAAIHYPKDHTRCAQNRTYGSPYEPGVLGASYNISQEATRLSMDLPEVRYKYIKRDVEDVHGLPRGYLDDIVIDNITVDWYKERWIFGEFPTYFPGQRELFLYPTSTPEYDNRVFFAGEHTSPKSAWMQGALESGMTAANRLAYYSRLQKRQ